MQYRKSIYRKRNVKAIVISLIVAFVVLFTLFMIIGTALHNKTQEPDPEDQQGNEQTAPPSSGNQGQQSSSNDEIKLEIPKSVAAYALPLLEDGSKFSDRLAKIPPTVNDVFVNLNSKDGALLFRSELASEFSHITVHADASALSNSVTDIEREGFYISGALYVPSFGEQNDLIRDIELSTWTAIACEALREGVGDVMLIAPSVDEEDIERLCAMADSIHSSVEKSVIGIALPSFVLEDENMIAIVSKLSKHFNYLSLDTTDYKSEDDALTHINDRILTFQHYILQYKMRVILPKADDTEIQQQYIDVAAKYNAVNWQIMP